jgi:hypothetical protein
MKFWELQIEDFTHLSGFMDSQYVFTSYRQFSSQEGAKKAAEEHYKRYNDCRGPIIWKKISGKITSGDLGCVMYTIQEKELE